MCPFDGDIKTTLLFVYFHLTQLVKRLQVGLLLREHKRVYTLTKIRGAKGGGVIVIRRTTYINQNSYKHVVCSRCTLIYTISSTCGAY